MKLRLLIALVLGLLLGLFISGFTYFNDAVVRQTMFIGNFLPISVFGLMVVGLLGVNPWLGKLRLTAAQVAIVVAVALAACGWPGSNLFRLWSGIFSMPAYRVKTEPSWQAAGLMQYLPGASAELAEGQVADWRKLAGAVVDAGAADAGAMAGAWRAMGPTAQRAARQLVDDPGASSERERLLSGLNGLIAQGGLEATPLHTWEGFAELDLGDGASALREQRSEAVEASQAVLPKPPATLTEEQLKQPELVRAYDAARKVHRLALLEVEQARSRVAWIDQRLNRMALVAALPGVLDPQPMAEGLLLADGRTDPFASEVLMSGWDGGGRLEFWELPWETWWPTVRLWGGLVVVLGLASLCLAVIVHPQWSRRELLAYPIARFVDEVAERSPGRWLPNVCKNRLFWVAFALLLLLHLLNGLNVWFPNVPKIALSFDFSALKTLFPNASRVGEGYAVWAPKIVPMVVAFAFFLSTQVSFSVGFALIAWMMLGSVLIASGNTFANQPDTAETGPMLRFGAYVGMALMMLYVGRRYYLNVAASAVGLPRGVDTPAYATWAARGLAVLLVLSVVILSWTGLDAPLSVVMVGLILLQFVVMSRVVCETGLIFSQAWWLPSLVVLGLGGTGALVPTTQLLGMLVTVVLLGDPREMLMPYLSNALEMGDRTGGRRPSTVAPALAVMVVLGFVVTLVVTLSIQYNVGINRHDSWATQAVPAMPFRAAGAAVSELKGSNELRASLEVGALDRLTALDPQRGAVGWAALGVALVLGCAAARLRLPWWPIHPVLFLVWGTYPNGQFWLSFMLGWAIKAAITKTTGAKGYHGLKPLMVGVIAGELTAGLLWVAWGVIYYQATGLPPKSYTIFPG